MDLISAFKSELFRPLATLVAPGLFAIAPALMLIAQQHEEVGAFLDSNPFGFAGLLLAVATAAGMILESVGARIEAGIDQCLAERCYPRFWDIWGSYLQLKTDSEVIGQRYARTVITRLKFSLSFAPSLILFAVTLLLVNTKLKVLTLGSAVCVATICFALAGFLLLEAVKMCDTLNYTRCRVLAAHDVECTNPEHDLPAAKAFVCYVLFHLLGFRSKRITGLLKSHKLLGPLPDPKLAKAENEE